MSARGSVLIPKLEGFSNGVTTLNDELGERILREIYDTKSDVKSFALALNALNTEFARMSVKVEQLSNVQQATVEHDRRLAKVEADVSNHEKNTQRIGELTRWVIAISVSSLISLVALAIQLLRPAHP